MSSQGWNRALTILPWEPIGTAPIDGRQLLVWNGQEYLWAAWRLPAFQPDPEHEGETWCEGRLPIAPPPTHWLPLSPPNDGAARQDDWTVTAYCWRRGPGGSIACYTLVQRRAWTRCYEHEGSDTISNETAEAVAQSMVQQLAYEVYPKLLYAVRSAQGVHPDISGRDQASDKGPSLSASPLAGMDPGRALVPGHLSGSVRRRTTSVLGHSLSTDPGFW